MASTQMVSPAVKTALLSLAKTGHVLDVIDPGTLKVEARIPVGDNPHEVIASADGRRAYVSNYGNGSLNTITVVDLVARKPLTTIDLGPLYGPHGLTFVGGQLYFTAEREKLIGRLDPATNKIDWLLGTGQVGTHMLWVAQDLHHIVTVSVGSGVISLINQKPPYPAQRMPPPLSKTGGPTTRGKDGPPALDWDETVIPAGTRPEGFDVLHDAAGLPTFVWAASVDGTVYVIDAAAGKVVDTIQAGAINANRFRFTPDGKLALISCDTNGTANLLIVVDVATRKVIKRLNIGTGGAGLLMEPNGNRAFVSSTPDNKVAVIDLKTLTVIGHIDTDLEPDGIAWAAPGDPNGGVSP